MILTSIEFLVFFTIVAAGNFLLPHRVRWIWLLAASLYFYGLFGPIFILQVLAASALSFYLAFRIAAAPERDLKKRILTLGVLLNVGNLVVFKYTSFLNESVRSVCSWFDAGYPVPVLDLLLPIGISFYTFQLISYLVDVYRGGEPERHFGLFALYVLFFTKIIAGPIERARNLLPQLHGVHHFDYARAVSGLQLMLWGWFQKVVVADRLAPFVNRVYDNPQDYDGVSAAFATFLYAFQIYCDFAGYTNIALGAALVLGFKLMENFNRPYFATSVPDFWKRWHISLTSWLTDYVYTPLSRSKKIKIKWYNLMLLSLFVTFIVSGFWHGAQWTFVAWGAVHAIFVVASTASQKRRASFYRRIGLTNWPRLHHAAKVASTFSLVTFAYIFFRANSMDDALQILANLFTGWSDPASGVKAVIRGRFPELIVPVLGAALVMGSEYVRGSGDMRDWVKARPAWARFGFYYAGAVSIVFFGAFFGGEQDFIYFRF